MKKTIVNIHDLINTATRNYIATNAATFKSTVAGPQGVAGVAGANGTNGLDGKSAYQIWLALGNTGSEIAFINSLIGSNGVDGVDGKSAYDIWLDEGNTGDEATFLVSLRGPRGFAGQSVHHTSYTISRNSLGVEIGEAAPGVPGNTDTYTVWDGQEELPEQWLGEFKVTNGDDAFAYATKGGYSGTEEEFYNDISTFGAKYTAVLYAADQAEADRIQVGVDAEQVAEDRIAVESARDATLPASVIAVASADAIQYIFLGSKGADPTVDNQGNPLVPGVMYYNNVSNTLRIWNGTEWNLGAFSAAGAVTTFNGRDGAVSLTNTDITLAAGVDLSTVEAGATADQTGAEIKALYEAEANTNAFTDAEKTKLANTEIASQLNIRDTNNRARANHTGTQTLDTITETTTKKIMTATERTKLAGIETGATADQTGAEIKALYEAQTGKILDNVTRIGLNGTSDIGRLVWDANEQTADLKLNSDVTLQLGQEELVLVKNSTGATIVNGKVVMVVGSNGNSGNLLVALHDGTKANAVPTLGITTQDIANGGSGFVAKSGKVRGLNTSGSGVGETWVDGDVLYVSTNGNLTKVVPGDTGLKMSIAVVINAHGSNGTLFVRTNGLDENHDKDWVNAKFAVVEW